MDTGVRQVHNRIEAAIKAAEKSPVGAVNKLWKLLGELDDLLESAVGKLEKETEKLRKQLTETERRADAAEDLAAELRAEMDTTPPVSLAEAVRGYMRAIDRNKSEKTKARCREQIDAILGPDPKAA